MRRLSLMQMFFRPSVDQTRQPELLSVTGLRGLHDAAQLVLQVAGHGHTSTICGSSTYESRASFWGF
jgi:hypothetical protein